MKPVSAVESSLKPVHCRISGPSMECFFGDGIVDETCFVDGIVVETVVPALKIVDETIFRR